MKKLFLLFSLAFMAMSCEQIQDFIDEKGHGLVFLEGEMKAYFDDKGDTKNYKFKADLAWSAEVSADWVEVDPTSGPAGENKIKIKVDKNKSDEKRTGYVDITLSNDKSYRIELEQLAAGENLDDVTPSTSIPNNEIWYTSADGNIVEPYSGEGSQDNFAVFGANVVSNIFDADKECWVIKFDGDVTTIGDYAFSFCSSLTSVTIPDSVTSIGFSAFSNCYSLRSVTIPDSVTTIGKDAFFNCYSLTSITIPDSVTTIGDYAFDRCRNLTSVYITDLSAWCKIDFGNSNPLYYAKNFYLNNELVTDLIIPSDITEIKSHAFGYCRSLTSVIIGDSVTTIGDYAFGGCRSLTSVTIPDSVTTIGEGAFWNCDSLNAVYITDLTSWCNIDFCTYIDGSVVVEGANPLFYAANLYLNGELVTDLVIPDGVTEIRIMLFAYCSSLTSVTIPDSVTTIGYNAFYDCSSLTSVTIGDSVTTIGDYAFYDCSSLTSVTIGDSVTTIGEGAFVVCDSLREFNGKYASEDGRCLIIDGTLNSFAIGCGVTEYTIPDSVTSIGDAAFAYCRSLTSVTIPDSVTTIGDCAFCSCSSLTSVTIGDSVTTIGDFAFASCSSLTSVTIPDSVTTIGYMAFAYCSSLTSVYCKAVTPPAVGYDMFYDDASDRKIYVPTESVKAYKSATGWSDYADAIVGYEF